MADNDNTEVMYEVWCMHDQGDYLLAVFPEKEDAEEYVEALCDEEYCYIEEAEYGE